MPEKRACLISVIDDDESIRDAIVDLMRCLGHNVKAFPSAIDFLASPEIGDNSCIIADVQMPHMTGIELYGRLKASGQNVPTILITAYPDDEARARALENGVICYLSKPLSADALIGCVQSALQSQGVSDA